MGYWTNVVTIGLAAVAAACVSVERGGIVELKLSDHTVSFVHLFSLCVSLGTQIWVTFVSGITLFKALPRQMFGQVQSKMFPRFFRLTFLVQSLVAATLYRVHGDDALGGNRDEFARLGSVLASVVAVALNLLLIGPKTSQVMFARRKLEKDLGLSEKDGKAPVSDDPRWKALSKKFGMFHGISSLLNLVSILAGLAYLSLSADRFQL